MIPVFGYFPPRSRREELYGIVARVRLAVRFGRTGRRSVSAAVAGRRCRSGCDWRAESLALSGTGWIAAGRQAFRPGFREEGHSVVVAREPGGTSVGEPGCRKILKEPELTDMHSSATDFFCWALAGANWWLRSSVRRRNGATSHCATGFRIRRSLTASAGSYLRDNCDQPLIYRRAGWFRTLSFTGTCRWSRSRLGAALANWLGWSVLRTESTNRGRLFLRRGDEDCRQLVGRHPGRIHVMAVAAASKRLTGTFGTLIRQPNRDGSSKR